MPLPAAEPKENPPAPILPDVDAALGAPLEVLTLPSSPGLAVSQAAHAFNDGPLVTMHTPHFHEPASDVLNMDPQPDDLASAVCLLSRAGSSSPWLPSSVSVSSPSPNNQPTYHSTNASLVIRIVLSPLDGSTEPIFLMVRLCSSSQ